MKNYENIFDYGFLVYLLDRHCQGCRSVIHFPPEALHINLISFILTIVNELSVWLILYMYQYLKWILHFIVNVDPPLLISPCQLPKLPGPCIAAIPRWWYSATSGRCEVFRYGGCCGNANNFLSREDCEKQCV